MIFIASIAREKIEPGKDGSSIWGFYCDQRFNSLPETSI
jgi:hypothetical protein